MRYSRSLKSSSRSLPSPDGQYIATVLPSKLSIRETRSLEIIRVISLSQELTASVIWFLWSASSDRLLIASANEIRVCSASNSQFSAHITHPTSGTTKACFIAFGATDDEVCVFSDFGLKLSVFNLATSKSVDINYPKFYNPGVASKGISYRPRTRNLALLTRSGGKDIVSIHAENTLEVRRSWYPETVDAQGLEWSPDGRWIAVWESASQGHRLLVYTADGHLYKTWNGPTPITDEETDPTLGAGVKLFCWNRTGSHLAVGDYSRRITILDVPSFTESVNLFHTGAVKPANALQIWQEQAVPSQTGYVREFTQATQTICPPTSGASPNNDSNAKLGTNMMDFDKSGTLLATIAEDMPTTLWIWDTGNSTLRAVMIFHAPIVKAIWHPSIDELLLVRCEGEETKGLVYVWDPSWQSPKILDFASQIPGGKVIGNTIGRWLSADSTAPAIFFSDTQDYMLASFSESDEGDLPWQGAEARAFDIYGQQEESPLNLVPAYEKNHSKATVDTLMEEDDLTVMGGGYDEVEDTFQFRKFVEPTRNLRKNEVG